MFLLGILLSGALQLQGNLKLSADMAVYPASDSGASLELYYDIPLTSLAFLKQEGELAARFSVGVQLLDRRGNPVAGDIWERTVTTSEYAPTIARDSSVTGTVSLPIPAAATRGHVQVTDLSSDRTAGAVFALEVPKSSIIVRLLRSGQPNPARAYRLTDTLEAVAMTLESGTGCDSFRFVVKDGRRALAAATLAAEDSGGFASSRFTCPVADSAGTARFSGGECALEVTAFCPGKNRTARVGFRVEVPFFLNDKAYREKVDELIYITTPSEMAELKRTPREMREQAWADFWHGKDPSPTTDHNETEEQYFARIEYAKERFGGADRGYRSDRGRVYVTYGPPDNVDSRPFELDVRAYEVWYYYNPGRQFVFVDRYGFGEFVLQSGSTQDGR